MAKGIESFGFGKKKEKPKRGPLVLTEIGDFEHWKQENQEAAAQESKAEADSEPKVHANMHEFTKHMREQASGGTPEENIAEQENVHAAISHMFSHRNDGTLINTETGVPFEKAEVRKKLRGLIAEYRLLTGTNTLARFSDQEVDSAKVQEGSKSSGKEGGAEKPSKLVERREKWSQEFAKKHGIEELRTALLGAEEAYKTAYQKHHSKHVNAFQEIDKRARDEYNAARLAWTRAVHEKIGALDPTASKEDRQEWVRGKSILHHDTILRAAEARTIAREEALSEKSKHTYRKALNWAADWASKGMELYNKGLSSAGKGIAILHHHAHKAVMGKELSTAEREKLAAFYGKMTGIVGGAVIGSATTALFAGSPALVAASFWGALGLRSAAASIGTIVGSGAGALAEKAVRGNTEKDAARLKGIRRNEAISSNNFETRDAIYDKGNREARAQRVAQARIAGTVVGGVTGGLGTSFSLHHVFGSLPSVQHATHALQDSHMQAGAAAHSSIDHRNHLPVASDRIHTTIHEHGGRHASAAAHGAVSREAALSGHNPEMAIAHKGEGAYALFHDLQKTLLKNGVDSDLSKQLLTYTTAHEFIGKLNMPDYIPEGASFSVDHDRLFFSAPGHTPVELIGRDNFGHFTVKTPLSEISWLHQHHQVSVPHEHAVTTHAGSVRDAASTNTETEINNIYKQELAHKGFAAGWDKAPTVHEVANGTYVAPSSSDVHPLLNSETPDTTASSPLSAPAPEHAGAPESVGQPIINSHNLEVDLTHPHAYAISEGGGKEAIVVHGGSNDDVFTKAQEIARQHPGKPVYFNAGERAYVDGRMQEWVSHTTYIGNGQFETPAEPDAQSFVGVKLDTNSFTKKLD